MPNVFLSEDYLMRMINQALAALAAMLGMKTAWRYQEAEHLFYQTLESLFGLRAGLLLQLDDDRLKEMMTYQGELNLQLLVVVADLFKEEGEILQAEGNLAGANSHSLRALNFYLEAIVSLNSNRDNAGLAALDAELANKVESLLRSLNNISLPDATAYLLFHYYKNNGHYREAETTLTSLEANMGRNEYTQEEIRDYYTGLLEKSDQDLINGGMEREEIRNKLGLILGQEDLGQEDPGQADETGGQE
jgi:Family of unknown function (DUF6483)